MIDMEHMSKRWEAVEDPEEEAWDIKTEEDEPWAICTIYQFLPNDETGELTAKAICHTHNAILTKKRKGGDLLE